MNVPDIKAIFSHGQGLCIPETAPWQDFKTCFSEGVLQFGQRGFSTFHMRLRGDNGPVMLARPPETDELHFIAKQFVLPEHAFQIVERKGVVQPRPAIRPTDGVASQIGLGVFPPEAGRRVIAHIMLSAAITLGRWKTSRENQAARFGPDTEVCPLVFGALEVVRPIK